MRGLLLALAACSGSASPAAPISNQPAAAGPASAAPSVRWNENNFDTARLPAIARDGALVVLGEVDEDGARGNPNLRIVTIDRANHRTSAFEVMTIDEYDGGTMFAAMGDRGPTTKLVARIAQANQILTDLATRQGLVPLTALTTDADITANIARGADGLEVRFSPAQLSIGRPARPIMTRDVPAAWIATPPTSVAGQPCEHTPYLGTVWLDEARKLAVITVNYTGTDMCWEPASRHLVIAW